MTTLRLALSLLVVLITLPSSAQTPSVRPSDRPPAPLSSPQRDVFAEATVGLLVQAGQPKQQDEFTPISELPPQEQYPAAPLIITAYAFVLVVLFGYLWSVSRRLTAIQREVDRLDADIKREAGH